MDDFNLEEYEKVNPVAEIAGVKYSIPTTHCLWRVKSLRTKEPDTLEWIAEFDKDDILLDVGANVGMYTLWAAVKQGVRVYAIEPESQNYALLNQNIFLNGVQDSVTAYCLALSDVSAETGNLEFANLNLSRFIQGGSCHSFGDEVDYNLKPVSAAFKQGCISITLDQFTTGGAMDRDNPPNHIKIDVDGIEHKVITGAKETLNDERVKSVLIELNTNLEQHNEIIGFMEGLGFTTSIHPQAIRTEGPFKGTGNHIFRRNS